MEQQSERPSGGKPNGLGAIEVSADAVLCRCIGVSREAVARAAAGGACFEQIKNTTRCGTICGECRWEAEEIVAASNWDSVAIAEPLERVTEVRIPIQVAEEKPLFADQPLSDLPHETIGQRRRRQVFSIRVMTGLAILFAASITGIVAVPIALLSGAIVSSTAIAAAIVIALVLAVDAFDAYREWRRIFFDEMTDADMLQAGMESPRLFRRSAPNTERGLRSVEIRRIVMQRLSLRQWLIYKMTLRIDYLLNDLWRSAAHAVRKSLLNRGVRCARRWSSLYQPHWAHIDRQLAELLIESSLMLGLNETWTDSRTGHTHGRFVYTDWVCPANPRFKDEAVKIDRFEVVVDLDQRRALRAAVNRREIGAGEDALVLADLCVSVNFHTILHAYANWACVPNHPDPVLAQAAVYTTAMNAQSWHAGYFANTDAANFRTVLERNAQRGIFAHGSGAMMRQLVRFSRTGAFILAARNATLDVIREHRVDIDPEAFFLMSVLHSVDHYVIAAAVDPINLHSELLGYGGAEWIRVLFQEPLRPLLANTRLSAQKSGWLADLYQRLCAIDPWYADRVDYCVRY